MSDRTQQNMEMDLLALFDAHRRVMNAKSQVLKQYDDPDARSAVIKSFDAAGQAIAEAAVDRAQGHADLMVKRQQRQQREQQEVDESDGE